MLAIILKEHVEEQNERPTILHRITEGRAGLFLYVKLKRLGLGREYWRTSANLRRLTTLKVEEECIIKGWSNKFMYKNGSDKIMCILITVY